MNICVIIPSYNLADKLAKCLDSLSMTNFLGISVIIFDNGSDPPLGKILGEYKKKFRKIVFLRSEQNLGFAKANNRSLEFGLKKFRESDYFLLLNNDAYVTKDLFTRSQKYLEKKHDLLSPHVLLTKNRGADSRGISYYRDGTGVNRTRIEKNAYLLPAACLFISKIYVRECLKKYGWMFNPHFGSYAEDIELSLRTELSNKKSSLIPYELVYHDRSSTINKKSVDFLSARNQLWIIITTWTGDMIKNNFFEVINGQINNTFVSVLKFRIIHMFRIYLETIFALPKLLAIRKVVQSNIVPGNHDHIFSEKPRVTFSTIIRQSRTYKKLFRKNI